MCWTFGAIEFMWRLVRCFSLKAAALLVVQAVPHLEVAPVPLKLVDTPLDLASAFLETDAHPICPF